MKGIELFWGRNAQNTEGKNITIEKLKYQVFVHAIDDKNGMIAPKIYYITNKKEGRSSNWLRRRLFYNIGYLYDKKWYKRDKYLTPVLYKNKGWYYFDEKSKVTFRGKDKEEYLLDFQMTAAHEIGHQILLKCSSFGNSIKHKETSTWGQKPANGKYEGSGEIDLMKYYSNYYDIERTIVSEKDLKGLLWLSKLKIYS